MGDNKDSKRMTRRQFILTGAAVAAGGVLAAYGIKWNGDRHAAQPAGTAGSTAGPSAAAAASPSVAATANAQQLEATPACGHADETVAVTEGPYFTPNSPERNSLLEAGMKGVKLTVTGTVVSTGCKPVTRALLDFWQADTNGQYDNKGYTLRGHQYTDANGKFTLETVVPGLYPGRTRHIHVKVQAPGGDILTTQLFFPGEAGNKKDGIYKDSLLMNVKDGTDGSKAGAFQFVLRT